MKANFSVRTGLIGGYLAVVLLLLFSACSTPVPTGPPDPAATLEFFFVTQAPTITPSPTPPVVNPLFTTPLVSPSPTALVCPTSFGEESGTRGAGEILQDGGRGAEAEVCGWKITFVDEFDGETIDRCRWASNYRAGDTEAQYYVEDAFELKDGILKIRAEERQVKDRKYASGILTSRDKFDQRYGRFEIRAKVPAGQALWPAFWLMPANKEFLPEIDVFEIIGQTPEKVYMSTHWEAESGERVYVTQTYEGPDFSQDFHHFMADWRHDRIIWYVDGVQRASQTLGVPDMNMFMILNLAVGGAWPGYPDYSTVFPSYFEVDFVRVSAWTCQEGSVEGQKEEAELLND